MSPWAPARAHACGALLRPGQKCPRCARAADQARGTATQRGYGSAHRRWRAEILARDSACRDPFGRHPGRLVWATVADHIVPVRLGGQWTEANGQGLCASCHAEKRRRERL